MKKIYKNSLYNLNKQKFSHIENYGKLDYVYRIKNKKKIKKFLETSNLKFLDQILPLKKKYNFLFPQIYIKSFDRLNKKIKNKIFFIEDYYNFSGSFKDRASLVACLDAKEKKMKEVSVASSGNAAISTAIFCNMFKLKCSVFIPKFTSKVKIDLLKKLGCKLFQFNLQYNDVVKKCLEYSKKNRTYNRCTGINPVTRDGKKIFSYQLISKFKKKIDYLVIPVGDGNILSGCLKGFEELYQNKFIKYKTNFVGVQSSQSPSFYNQFINNRSEPQKNISFSKCDSINVDYPLDGYFAYKYLKKMSGFMMKIDDKKIVKSREILMKQYGINCCLASASTFAILNNLILKKKLKNKNIFLLLTGTGYKDLGVV